jgi:hypothetical protein
MKSIIKITKTTKTNYACYFKKIKNSNIILVFDIYKKRGMIHIFYYSDVKLNEIDFEEVYMTYAEYKAFNSNKFFKFAYPFKYRSTSIQLVKELKDEINIEI